MSFLYYVAYGLRNYQNFSSTIDVLISMFSVCYVGFMHCYIFYLCFTYLSYYSCVDFIKFIFNLAVKLQYSR